jgi:hypothetical protein
MKMGTKAFALALTLGLGAAFAVTPVLAPQAYAETAKKKKKKAKAPVSTNNTPAGCVEGKVLSAMQLRIVQTELMVAGLSCKGYPQWQDTANTKRYNEFVTSYQPILLNDAHKVLARFFKAETKLNDYLTRLANDSSQRSLANMAIFCDGATRMYNETLATPRVHLANYAGQQGIGSTHGFPVCNQPLSAETPVTPVSIGPTAAAPPVLTAAPAVVALNTVPSTASDGAAIEPTMTAAVKNPPKPKLKPPTP